MLHNEEVVRFPIKWIIKNSKKQMASIIFVSVLYMILAGVGVYSALIAKGVIDSATTGDGDGVILYGSLYAGIIIFNLLLGIITKNLYFLIDAKLTLHFRKKIFELILKKDYFKISSFHSGELLNRITNDVFVIIDAIVSVLPTLTYVSSKIIGVLVILISIDYMFALVFVVGGAFMVLVTHFLRKRMKALHKKIQETEGATRSFMQEIIAGLLMVKVFDAKEIVSQKAQDLQMENFKVKRKRNIISVISNTSFSFVFSAGYLYGLLWGAFNIVEGVITFGTLTAILSLVSQIQAPISSLSNIVPKYYAAVGSAERLMDIESMENDMIINESKVDAYELYENLDAVIFDDISFKYDREIILKNTELKINKGDFLVIMGISGIGKSTLTKLLMGVYPTNSGQIYFQKKNGEKVFADKRIRKLYAYVPQGNFLISGTIRDNLAFVCPNATDEEINRAIDLSCARNFVDELPQGLQTVIGERGQGLSEGQVQRVAIARALLTDAPILILDEATSALDENTEKQVLENIKSLNNKTCVIISHKKAAESVCNRHIKIIGGKIVEWNVESGKPKN